MRDLGKSFDLKGFAEAFGEALDVKGVVAGFRSALDLPGVRKSFVQGVNDGAALLASPIRWLRPPSAQEQQLRGDYDAALDRYRRSLAIKEQLGDRAGMATSYHQLGNVAFLRGDYDAALDWYRKSLAIAEQLGDRAGMAATVSNLGALYTVTERLADAIPFNLRSLALRLEMQSREVGIDLRWLSRQRAALDAAAFRAIVAEHVGAANVPGLLKLLDDFEAAQKAGGASDAGRSSPLPPP